MERQLQTRLATTFTAALAGALLTMPALAQQVQPRGQAAVPSQVRAQERIYGEELMTPQERNAYRERMRALETEQQRAAYGREHQQQMQSRAAERGVTLPEQASQERPGEARQGPSPSGKSQAGAEGTRQRDKQQQMQREREMQERTMRDQSAQGARKPHGNRR